MTLPHDLVTVVIPTRNRPELVKRAVESALAQTYAAIDVIVVIDGPDPNTMESLNGVADPRLTVIALETNIGAAKARNLAVERAKGAWIAFLDDDDYWLPEKIAVQMAARPPGLRYPIMSCCCKVVTARGVFMWPRRLATPQDRISDYLFVRHGLLKGETFAPTSTLLVPRELLIRHPIPVSLFDDWEWLITCSKIESCALITVPETLTVHYTETNSVTLSTHHTLDGALAWAHRMKPHLSPRAYACLLLQTLGGEPSARSTAIRWRILTATLRGGSPTPVALATFVVHSLFPVTLRRWLRQALSFTRTATG